VLVLRADLPTFQLDRQGKSVAMRNLTNDEGLWLITTLCVPQKVASMHFEGRCYVKTY